MAKYKKPKGMSLSEIKVLSGKQIYSADKWARLRHSEHIVKISMLGKTKKGKKGVQHEIIFNDGSKRKSIKVFF